VPECRSAPQQRRWIRSCLKHPNGRLFRREDEAVLGPIKVLRPNLKLCIDSVKLPYLCVPLEMNFIPIQSQSYGFSQMYFLM
jgi:hypothetical protein